MEHFGSFFKKFKKLTTPDRGVREICASYCTTLLKKDIPLSVFRVEGVSIYLDLPAILKSEVMINKESLLDCVNKALESKGDKKRFTAIR